MFVVKPSLRLPMLWASVLTAPFGLTELAFVPKYWNPPSLFDLAHRTGFDIESLIFCFAIGGILGWPFAMALCIPFLLEEIAFAFLSDKDAIIDCCWRLMQGTVAGLLVLVSVLI